ncbi:hypothetical protein ACHWQZ_G008418 [Mnemiopsis leidyi]
MNFKLPIILALLTTVPLYFLLPSSTISDELLSSHLHDKVVLLTGADCGVGEELAYQVAGLGAKLVLVGESPERLNRIREGVISRGTPEIDILAILFDFTEVNITEEIVKQAINKFGGLDYLVLNHNVKTPGPFLSLSYLQNPDFIEQVFTVNLFSHIQLTLHALPYLEKRRGHMFLSSALSGEIPLYGTSSTLHSSSIHGLNGFFYSLQQELIARDSPAGITVGTFGFVWTRELSVIYAEGNPKPDWVTGSEKDAARRVLEAYVTRPQAVTFPKFAGIVHRMLSYFFPQSLKSLRITQDSF